MVEIDEKIINSTNYLDLNSNNFQQLKRSLNSIEFGDLLSIDIETTGLSFIHDDILLVSLYFNNESWVINVYNNNSMLLLFDYLLYIDKVKSPIWIGHNIAFDLRMMYYKYHRYKLDNIYDLDALEHLNGISKHRDTRVEMFTHIYCTYITEFRLFQGLDKKNGLADVALFRLGFSMKKETRGGFYSEENKAKIKANREFIPTKEEIIYTALDTVLLPDIRELQLLNIYEIGVEFILDVDLDLINTLVELEIKGTRFDKRVWLKQVDINLEELERNRIAVEDYLNVKFPNLDYSKINKPLFDKINKTKIQIDKLIEDIPIKINKANETINKETVGYKKLLEQIDKNKIKLEEYKSKLIELEKEEKVNWTSSKQLKFLTYEIGMEEINELPKKKDKGVFKFSMDKDTLSQWKINNPESFYYDFIDLVSKYKKVDSALSKSGLSWLDNFYHKEHPNLNTDSLPTLNNEIGRVHTILHQAKTDTGRLSSGDTKNGFVQTQNIYSTGLYRQAFIANEGFALMTIDWSGAELRIMEGVSKDECIKYVRENLGGDSHSYVAQHAWREVYKYRASKENDPIKKAEYLDLSSTLIITNKINVSLRKKFKNVHFGILYGAFTRTVAKSMGITIEEAEIVIRAVQDLEAAAYNHLKDSAIFTMLHGYTVTHDKLRTRKYSYVALKYLYEKGLLFKFNKHIIEDIKNDPIKIKKFTEEMLSSIKKENFLDAVSLDTKTRNLPIQGSQAEALKIYLCNFRKLRTKMHLEDKLSILLTVHDEVVHELPLYLSDDTAYNSLPKIIEREMCDSADIVLNGFTKMTAEYVIANHWEK